MILLTAHELNKAFGARPLFTDLTFSISDSDRIGLVGPNGAGKSTLLKMIAGQISPDSGRLSSQKGLRIGFLEQTPTFAPGATIFETIQEGTSHLEHDWEQTTRVNELMSRYELDTFGGDREIASLSGGWQRRVALAREIAREPGLLLLDEPTNHLDVESILWLERLLANSRFAILCISHDRVFLSRMFNRMIELDRRHAGGILSVQGSYADYLETRAQEISAQERREVVLRNTLRREVEWLRRGPQARTTKQQARIDRAHELQDTVQDLNVRNQNRTARIDFQTTGHSPKKLIEAKAISKSYGDRKLFSQTSLMIRAGSRVGLLGRNGAGKSTLIRVLLGREAPTSGSVVLSDQIQVAYFDQTRHELDPELTVANTLCPSGSHVEYRGAKVHIRGYLDRFLFTPAQMDFRVGDLSGGEQSRLLMARLMLEPANLLVLDEPTNDLDFATLGVLEECLTEFSGAVIVVSHDRYFLDQVSTQMFALDPNGGPLIPFADLAQWETWVGENQRSAEKKSKESAKASSQAGPKKKLGFLEQRELDGIEQAIQAAEALTQSLEAESQMPELAANVKGLTEHAKKMAAAEAEVQRLYARWEELLKKASS